jgi:hypothetical protein
MSSCRTIDRPPDNFPKVRVAPAAPPKRTYSALAALLSLGRSRQVRKLNNRHGLSSDELNALYAEIVQPRDMIAENSKPKLLPSAQPSFGGGDCGTNSVFGILAFQIVDWRRRRTRQRQKQMLLLKS